MSWTVEIAQQYNDLKGKINSIEETLKLQIQKADQRELKAEQRDRKMDQLSDQLSLVLSQLTRFNLGNQDQATHASPRYNPEKHPINVSSSTTPPLLIQAGGYAASKNEMEVPPFSLKEVDVPGIDVPQNNDCSRVVQSCTLAVCENAKLMGTRCLSGECKNVELLVKPLPKPPEINDD